jgi:hypothetical protein
VVVVLEELLVVLELDPSTVTVVCVVLVLDTVELEVCVELVVDAVELVVLVELVVEAVELVVVQDVVVEYVAGESIPKTNGAPLIGPE